MFSYTKQRYFDLDEISKMESIADQIRIAIAGNKGIILSKYIEKTSAIPLVNIGIENINEIKNNEEMQCFFPDKVWEILKKRCDEYINDKNNIVEFENEKEIVSNKPTEISVSKINKYDEKTMNFIRSNAHMGCRWIADQLGYTYDAIQKKCKREKIILAKIKK